MSSVLLDKENAVRQENAAPVPLSGKVEGSNTAVPLGSASLHRIVLEGNEEALKKVLRNPDVDVNVRDRFGYTPLFTACRNGRKGMIWRLVERGASVV